MVRRAVVVDLDLGFNKIIADLERAATYTLLVGIQEGSKTTAQVKAGRKQKAGLNIAEYAAQNEFGTDKIPERSFMRTAIDENIPLITKAMSKEIGKVIDGNQNLLNAFNVVGLVITGLIRRKIRQIRFPPNSPYTIAMKNSSKPLIDFGAMIDSVRHVVRRRGVKSL